MNIAVLQGLNKQHPGTTIKIQLASPIFPEIMEKIKNLHPVFMEDYKINGNILIVHSKLAHLWVEIGNALINLSNRDWTVDFTQKYIFETIICSQMKSMSIIPVINSAIEERLEITQYFFKEGIQTGFGEKQFNSYYCIGCGKESHIINNIASSKDSHFAQKTQKNKWTTNLAIERLGIPVANWQPISSEEQIKEIWEKYTKPVVIKPVGLSGGNGVTTNINSLQQAIFAFKSAEKRIAEKERPVWQQKIMMQEQAEGEDYRILVINGKFEIATKRIPAFVTGNGKDTLEELIKETNKDPRRDTSNPTHILKPIVIDDDLKQLLKDQNLNLKYVPKKDEKVSVRKVASMSKGGITEDFTDKVSTQIKYVCESLATSIHAYVLGVDILCKDISKPLTRENGIIIECNTMPEAYLNAFPVIGKQYPNTGKIFLNSLIEKERTKRIVYIGQDSKKVRTHIKGLIDTDERIGLLSEGTIYINEEILTRNENIIESFEAMKLNNSLSSIVFHLSEEDFEMYGTGFEYIDIAVVSDKVSKKTKDIIQGYGNLGYITKVMEF
ncbi:hypothetical protein M0R04_03150 [Candidatus Dojkabacteria bacterium]|jgi:cyanophycin synthetase|nr:hypothetical protein [Candidatus Dojkabacteria bacterium]